MSRASVTEALILRASRVGEYHKQLLLLTPDTGLVKALAFGAFKGKSRLVSASDPYSHARIHLYRNPVRDLLKITDIEVIHTYEGLRNDLERSYAAALLAELVAASYGGGGPDYRYPFGLLRRCLMVLETGDARAGRRTVFQFLLRFLLHAGFLGSPGECGRCGVDFSPSQEVFFYSRDGELMCGSCAVEGSLPVSPGVRRHMEGASKFPLSRALEIGTDTSLEQGLVRLLRDLLQITLNLQLKSFEIYFGLPVV
ncbi:DNA repair protein RecO [Marispirochaeta aestuarii]|uniref:DNA repair protein RecO n=1 Tax=Marispirochaeta aestuarii TaxID=1963862 RepID=A0A1Y1RWB7_9SPIO|nr:DNA repair protein RecO [Marispirochaeta aestuarii]ORC34467.1 DNA repair protein RecO [Marispirochaeta aestuarii]